MSAPEQAKPLTTDSLYQKIGVLTVSNEFLSSEVQRLNAWIATTLKDVHEEIAKIEAEIEQGASQDVKSLVARIKAKIW